MDNELAKSLLIEGGTLIVLDMPPGTEFGIDLNTWNVGHKFKGIKMIPPGLHFIYFSAVNQQGQVAPRTGFFHYFKQREIVLKHYDPATEDLKIENSDDEQQDRIRERLKDLDNELGAYPLDSWKNWISLINLITLEDIDRIIPLNGRICSVPELVHDTTEVYKSCLAFPNDNDNGDGSQSALKSAEERMPKMMLKSGTELRFSSFPKRPYKDGASPDEITKCSLDPTYSLLCAIEKLKMPNDILSELQLSFVCFLVGQVWEGWEHWKKLLGIICRAEEFLNKYPDIFVKFISILHFQIQKVPEDLFIDIVECNNFLAVALAQLFANVADNESTLPKEILTKSSKFKSHIRTKFKWNLSLEDDEDCPVIVTE